MKRSCAVIGGALLSALIAAAQEMPRMEAFVGYTYVRTASSVDIPALNFNGASGQFAYNFNTWLGAVADIGAVHNGNISGFAIDNTTASFLVGPRLSFRYPRLRPYFQVLWGAAYLAASTQINGTVAAPTPYEPVGGPIVPGQPITARLVTSDTAFAMTAGGGLDIKINKHVSFRPLGLDYFLCRSQGLRTQGDKNQNDLRYTAGFNFNFGAQ